VPDGADEPRLDAVGSRINAEAGLRAMMAIDQATLTARLDAQDHLLRAPAVTQSEHGAQLRELATEQARLATEQARLATEQARLATEQARLAEEQQRAAGTVTRSRPASAPSSACSAGTSDRW
jgi:septal ring factor EnvC (AmiA/AmiB activator)